MKANSGSDNVMRAAQHPPAPPAGFVPLELETRTCLPTDVAAYHLGRRPQTLREYACKESGPIRALRVHGRLAWPTDQIRQLLGVAK